MSLAARIKSAMAAAAKHGDEMFGYHVRADGSLLPMTRPKGVGAVLAAALDDEPHSSTRGVAASAPPAQGTLL